MKGVRFDAAGLTLVVFFVFFVLAVQACSAAPLPLRSGFSLCGTGRSWIEILPGPSKMTAFIVLGAMMRVVELVQIAESGFDVSSYSPLSVSTLLVTCCKKR